MKTANCANTRATSSAAKPSSSRSTSAPRGVSSLPANATKNARNSKSAASVAPTSPPEKTLFDAPVAVPAKKAKVAKVEAPETAKAASAPVAAANVSVKKRRAPSDLAVQYGEREAKRAAVVPVEATPAKRPRRDAAARAKLKGLMTPDEALLNRLARMDTVSTAAPVVTLEDDGLEKPARRSRVQEVSCGKCGASSRFSTPATLCARCGAILLKA